MTHAGADCKNCSPWGELTLENFTGDSGERDPLPVRREEKQRQCLMVLAQSLWVAEEEWTEKTASKVKPGNMGLEIGRVFLGLFFISHYRTLIRLVINEIIFHRVCFHCDSNCWVIFPSLPNPKVFCSIFFHHPAKQGSHKATLLGTCCPVRGNLPELCICCLSFYPHSIG